MNFNKVILGGRVTRDPESRSFANGGKVAKFGLAVNNSKKNKQTGEWENDPVFLDVEAFNQGDKGRQADLVEQLLGKGAAVLVEGRLQMDQWTDQGGQKRQKMKVVLQSFQLAESKAKAQGDPVPADDFNATGPGPVAEDIPF